MEEDPNSHSALPNSAGLAQSNAAVSPAIEGGKIIASDNTNNKAPAPSHSNQTGYLEKLRTDSKHTEVEQQLLEHPPPELGFGWVKVKYPESTIKMFCTSDVAFKWIYRFF